MRTKFIALIAIWSLAFSLFAAVAWAAMQTPVPVDETAARASAQERASASSNAPATLDGPERTFAPPAVDVAPPTIEPVAALRAAKGARRDIAATASHAPREQPPRCEWHPIRGC